MKTRSTSGCVLFNFGPEIAQAKTFYISVVSSLDFFLRESYESPSCVLQSKAQFCKLGFKDVLVLCNFESCEARFGGGLSVAATMSVQL